MIYFDTIVNGNKLDKAEMTFMYIAIGNDQNFGKIKEEMEFMVGDIVKMILLLRTNTELSSEDALDEDYESILEISQNLHQNFEVSLEEAVPYNLYMEKVSSDPKVMEAFKVMGNGLKALMVHSGENKYTKTVRMLRIIDKKFKPLVDELKTLDTIVNKK